MKTPNTKLNFKKDSIVELNDNQLKDVNGGTSSALTVLSSLPCGVVATVAVSIASVVIIANTVKN